MPTEYVALAYTTLFFLFAWLPSSIAKKQSYGTKWLVGNRNQSEHELSAWGQRAERAYQNLKDYFPGYAVAIILLGITNSFNQTTAILAWAYLGLRVLHMVGYIAGIPLLRASGWIPSMICLVWLFAILLF